MVSNNTEDRLKAIEDRNNRVESDKAWETSWTRRLSIMTLTYVVVAFYLQFVVHISPWINALVPVLGFLFSTFTISLLKKKWLEHREE